MPFDTQLWHKLCDFSLDDPQSRFPFSARLARDMNWSSAFTRRAIEEYKRFAYLACRSGHPVTPSEEVDAVWHLHLTYSRSYWLEFCQHVIARPLHHGPTRGGTQEAEKYREQYTATLASYGEAFGHPPPADLWPKPDLRFARTTRRMIDTQDHWIIPKGPFRTASRAISRKLLLGVLVAGSTGTAIAAADKTTLFGLTDAQQWILGGVICVGFLVWLLLFRSPGSSQKKNGSNSGCGATCGSDSDSGCGGGCGGD